MSDFVILQEKLRTISFLTWFVVFKPAQNNNISTYPIRLRLGGGSRFPDAGRSTVTDLAVDAVVVGGVFNVAAVPVVGKRPPPIAVAAVSGWFAVAVLL